MGDIQAINVHVNLHTLQWKVDGGKGKMVRKPCPIKYHFNWKFYKKQKRSQSYLKSLHDDEQHKEKEQIEW